jgi:hypothetical protein
MVILVTDKVPAGGVEGALLFLQEIKSNEIAITKKKRKRCIFLI